MRSHQEGVAALEQWKPLIEKMAFKAARRAAAIKSPLDVDDFRQELQMTVLRALDSYDADKGAKFITFLHSAFFHEINKLLRRDHTNCQFGYTISGDTAYDNDGEGTDQVWDGVEDDQHRSGENEYMDAQLMDHVLKSVSPEASAVLQMLTSGDEIVSHQLEAYNYAVELDASEGGIRRLSLDMNFQFICKLLGFAHAKMTKLANEIHGAIATYG